MQGFGRFWGRRSKRDQTLVRALPKKLSFWVWDFDLSKWGPKNLGPKKNHGPKSLKLFWNVFENPPPFLLIFAYKKPIIVLGEVLVRLMAGGCKVIVSLCEFIVSLCTTLEISWNPGETLHLVSVWGCGGGDLSLASLAVERHAMDPREFASPPARLNPPSGFNMPGFEWRLQKLLHLATPGKCLGNLRL